MRKNLEKVILLSLFLLLAAFPVLGQVGIGNANPDSTSVLDLTNTSNKGLVLPPATSVGSFSTSPVLGMTYFSGNLIHFLRGEGEITQANAKDVALPEGSNCTLA